MASFSSRIAAVELRERATGFSFELPDADVCFVRPESQLPRCPDVDAATLPRHLWAFAVIDRGDFKVTVMATIDDAGSPTDLSARAFQAGALDAARRDGRAASAHSKLTAVETPLPLVYFDMDLEPPNGAPGTLFWRLSAIFGEDCIHSVIVGSDGAHQADVVRAARELTATMRWAGARRVAVGPGWWERHRGDVTGLALGAVPFSLAVAAVVYLLYRSRRK